MRVSGAALSLLLCGASIGGSQSSDSAILRPVHYDLGIQLDLGRERMRAVARIRLRNETGSPAPAASLLLYRLLSVDTVRDDAGTPLPFTQTVVSFDDFSKQQVNRLVVPLRPALAPGKEATLTIAYAGHILGYAETGMSYMRDRIDTTYTLLRMDTYAYPQPGVASRAADRRMGLPVFDYVARINVPRSYTVANGGLLTERSDSGPTTTFVYRSIKPSWRMDFAVARFSTLRDGDLAVHYLPADSVGARRLIGAMTRAFALHSRWFGRLQGSAAFSVIELPDGWGSQADVTSILQSAAAFQDPRRESELYHEISHLWNGTTETPMPRWDEGLATFLEDVTVDSLTGRITTDSNAMRVARWLRDRIARDSSLRLVPMADYGKAEMTGYSYWVGSTMFYALYRIVGHDTFCRIIGEYYRRHASVGGSSARFAQVATEVSGIDLGPFFDEWLFSTRWTSVVANASSPRSLYDQYRRR